MLKCTACLLEPDCKYNARWLLHGMPVRGCKYKHKPYAQRRLRSSMQYSQIATSMSPEFMQKIVQNADGADPVSGLSGSKIAHHTASPITIIKQPRPCTMQLHSVNPTTCMQTRFKFHGIGVAMMHTARATPAGARSTAAQGQRCSNSAHSHTASSTALTTMAAA